MKIIDLLNKIANGEEVPNKFKYDNLIFKKRWDNAYFDNDGDDLHNSLCIDFSNLNDEVEIIGEDKEIEKIDVIPYEKCIHEVTHKEKEILLEIRDIQMKVNKIIDCLMENKDV